ncbi:MAG: phospho-N-acetylmuramoyl-pentapeptide-transferase, partial [Bacteroidaceae bacterium]|nr:phospho-N-acetylmuramoyl-pentapeptide-transferase [Bacteroidaceae bacterium]
MLYYIFDLFAKSDLPGARLMHYTSFRALLAVVISLVVSAWFGSYLIKYFKKKQITETLREYDKNNLKAGVPTMGGLIIIIAILVPCLLLGNLGNVYMLLLIASTIWLGILGFADDYIKTFKKNKEGIPGKVKILAQVGLGLLIGLTLCFSPKTVMRDNTVVENNGVKSVVLSEKATKENKTTIPFVKGNDINYSEIMSFCGDYKEEAGWALFVLVTIFVVTAVSNGANLNDGMDGMLAGNAAIIGIALAILAYASSHVVWAEYLNIMFLPVSDGAVTPTYSWVEVISGGGGADLPWVTPQDYGAVGDGVTDDTQAIVAAETAANTSSKVLYFPSGTYKVQAGAITCHSGMTWIGEDKKSIIIVDQTAT